MSDARHDFVITRSFAAPRAAVWRAWSETEALAQWWGPKGSTIRVLKFDFRPGGVFHYAMQFQPGQAMYGRFVYREIAAPERLVFVSSFSDAEGGIARAPFPTIGETWPLEIVNTMTLIEIDRQTTLTLSGQPVNPSTDEERTFAGMFDSMREGFTGTFDKLDAFLARR